MKEMRGIHKFTWRMPSAARCAALAVAVAGSAWAEAPTATAVWDTDQIKAASDGTITAVQGDFTTAASGYTLTLNTGNTVDTDTGVITIGGSTGVTFSIPSDDQAATMAVVFKYSGISAPAASYAVAASTYVVSGTSAHEACISAAADALAVNGYYDGDSYSAITTCTLSMSGGYLLFTHSNTGGTRAYAGSSLSTLQGATASGLKWGSHNPTTVAIGGQTGLKTSLGTQVPWAGMQIEKIAFFKSSFFDSNSLSEFEFPSDASSSYSATITADTDFGSITWDDSKTLSDATADGCTITLTIQNDAVVTMPATFKASAVTATGGTLKFAASETEYSVTSEFAGTSAIAIESGATVNMTSTSAKNTITNAGTLNATTSTLASITNTGTLALTGTTLISTATLTNNGTVSADADTVITYLTGSGTLTYSSYPSSTPTVQNGWTGEVTISGGTTSNLKLSGFGNSSTKVTLDGVTVTGMSTTYSDQVIGELNVGSNGLTFSINSRGGVFIIPAKLTGTGQISTGGIFGSVKPYLYFTGDASEFAGSLTTYRRGGANAAVQFIDTDLTSPSSDDNFISNVPNGAIAIAAGTTVNIAEGNTWTAQGNFIVEGTINLNGTMSGTISSGTGTIMLGGIGVISSTSLAASEDWTGTMELVALDAPASATQLTLLGSNYAGNDNSWVKLNTIAADTYGYYFPTTVTPKLKLAGDVATLGGSATTIPYLTGTGNFTAGTAAHTITLLDGYTGTLGTADGGSIVIGTVNLTSTPSLGDTVVATTVGANITDVEAIEVTVNGEATDFRLTLDNENGGLKIVAVATISGGDSYTSVAEAISAAESGSTIVINQYASETLSLGEKDITFNVASGITLGIEGFSGSGTLAITGAGSLEIAAGTVFATLSIGEDVAVSVIGTIATDTLLFSYTDGTGYTKDTLTVEVNDADTAIHYTATTADGVTSLTAGRRFYLVNTAALPGTASNWAASSQGTPLTGEQDIPGYFDTAVLDGFISGVNLTAGTTYYCNFEVTGDISIGARTRNGKYYLGSSTYAPLITVSENATLKFTVQHKYGGVELTVYSKIEGSGNIIYYVNSQSDYIHLNGDMSEFTGTVDVQNETTGIFGTYLGSAYTDHSLARWNISTNGYYFYRGDRAGYTPFSSGTTYKFGSLKAFISDSNNGTGAYANYNVVLEIGENIDEDSWLGNKWCVKSENYGGTVKWKAPTATLTNEAANAYNITLMGGGYLYLPVNSDVSEGVIACTNVPSVINFTDNGGYLTIDDDNAAIAGDIANAISTVTAGVGFNVTAEDAVSAAVTASSLLADCSFNKKGSGTLTLSGAFTSLGTINVTEGTLVVKTTTRLTEGAAENGYVLGTAKCKETTEDEGATYVYTFALNSITAPDGNDEEVEVGYMDGTTAVITNTSYSVTVPEGATAVAVSINREPATLVTSLFASDVTVYATDANGAATSTAIAAGALTFDTSTEGRIAISLNASGTVDGISVTPQVDEETDNPFVVAEDGVGFAVKTIPGLWYGIATSETGSGTFSIDDKSAQLATGTSTSLSSDDVVTTVIYYKIRTAISKDALLDE